MSRESLETQIAKMIKRQLHKENTKVNQQLTLLQSSAKEIRDYAKEELDKVRDEMQQFARVLDTRFGDVASGGAAA